MATLTDYLDLKTLQQLNDSFSGVAAAPIRIVTPDGEALTEYHEPVTPIGSEPEEGRREAEDVDRGDGTGGLCEVPVVINDNVVGRLQLRIPQQRLTGTEAARTNVRAWSKSFLHLMAGVIARLWDREKELRARVEELGTLYRLSAEFSGLRDLQTVLDLVAETVVDVLKGKACSIRLLSEDRTELVIKAVANLSEEYLDKGPILLSESKIDQEVLSTGKVVYIPDERTDPRVLYSAEARREGIVSALCAPLIYKGRAEGVIHVYMSELHEFEWFEASLLHAVAGEASAAIVNARLYEEAERSANMRRALQMAAEVQRRMIPAEPPSISGFQIGAVYVPTFELGGDFYDFIDLAPDNLGVGVCDVVGKGVRASLLMATIRAALRAHAVNIYDMSEVLRRVNADLCADTLASDFATLFYGVIDTKKRRFTYANAGHLPPILFRAGSHRELGTGGTVIGINPDMTWRHESFALERGDVLLAYTDGLSEAMNFEDEPFGRWRVEQAAQAAIEQGQTAEGIAKHILWEMRRFAGLQTRLDDVTIVAIKVL